MGYPPPSCPQNRTGYVAALSLDRTGYPHPHDKTKGVSSPYPAPVHRTGYCPTLHTGQGVHPWRRPWTGPRGNPPPQTGPGTTLGISAKGYPPLPPPPGKGYDAGGTPLAVTQEDFLVLHVPTKPCVRTTVHCIITRKNSGGLPSHSSPFQILGGSMLFPCGSWF